MDRRTSYKVGALLGLLVLATALFSACSTGVSQADLDAAKQQIAAKEQEAAAAKQQIAAKDQEVAAAKQQLQAAQAAGQQVTTLQQQLAAAQKDLDAAKAATGNSIMAAVPNAPPRATPAPLPPGATPAPKPVPPEMTKAIGFYVDTVTSGLGESQFKVDPNLTCVRLSAFKRGMHVVWRMQIVDTSNGKVIKGDDTERATLKFANGETRNFAYGKHGATDDTWQWTTAWDVPMDYPLGTVDYTIEVATKSGKTGAFKEIPVTGSLLQVVQ
ncbi:MAG: hypothetical protein Q7R39_09770 [Dehalococcoidia bacterium]|nr:hypothetical protein [Dehalococcoidia bacterium]